jgi:hypothetical protein
VRCIYLSINEGRKKEQDDDENENACMYVVNK